MQKVDIRDILDMHFVSDPSFSPDGRYVAYQVQTPSMESNRYNKALYLLDWEKKDSRQLTPDDMKIGSWCWTEEGKILFAVVSNDEKYASLRDIGNLTTLSTVDPDSGKIEEAFTLPLANAKLEPMAGGYAVTARVDLNMPCDGENLKERLAEYRTREYETYEEIPFHLNGVGFSSRTRVALFTCGKHGENLTRVTPELFQTDFVQVDGREIYYCGVIYDNLRPRNAGGYVYNADTGNTTTVYNKGDFRVAYLNSWNENEAIALSIDWRFRDDCPQHTLYLWNKQTHEFKPLTTHDRTIGNNGATTDAHMGGGTTIAVHNGELYFVGAENEDVYLSKMSQDGTFSRVYAAKGSCESFSLHGTDVVLCGMYGNHLSELYTLSGEQLTHHNDAYEATHSILPAEDTVSISEDGEEIRGFCVKPLGYTEGRKYPAILFVHGGPFAIFSHIFHHEIQVWANAGYFVLYCNPRGSEGRGEKFGNLGGRYGTVDYQDIMSFTDQMLIRYPDIDKTRVGVAGGSYGGFMTNWIIGHTDRFAAAVSQRSISNMVSMEFVGDNGMQFVYNQMHTSFHEDPAVLWNFSPLKYAGNCVTPTLFVQSDQDYRCPMEQAIEMYVAVKQRGVDTKLVLFHGENHELSRSGKPRNRLDRLTVILDWFNTHLQG